LSTFTPSEHNASDVSYKDYYREKYNIVIKDEKQFLLVSKARERDIRAGLNDLIYLIPELSRATGMTDSMRNNFELMKELSEHTRLNPDKRVKALNRFNNRIQSTPESVEVLREWNMELGKDLLTVPARELPRESIVFGNDHQETASERGEWTLRGKTSLYKPVPVKRWVCIFPESMRRETAEFVTVLTRCCEEMGAEMTPPLWKALDDDKQDSYIESIRKMKEKNPKMFLIVLPTNRADRYSSVKKACLVEIGVPAQVVVKRTITRKNVGSIASKVAIQMIAKMGGLPWMIKLPVKGLMTVGFDVSHHPRDKSRSVGALVATMDLKKTEACYSVTSSYRDGNEMNIGLANHMAKALEIFKETSGGVLPERILFYRDGVGEGQIRYVEEQEVKPLMKKLKEIYGNSGTPKLAYIIVNKRTNTRLFKQATATTFINPKPGTIVDQKITLPERNDFFLVSQHVGQGTVSPTSYNIIYNNSELSKDKLEILTYKFTHLYFNWSGTTRIPAVSQYAKKLAFLTSQSLQAPVHEKLEQSLYFL
jgi:aubergine